MSTDCTTEYRETYKPDVEYAVAESKLECGVGFLSRGSQGGDDPGCCGAKVGPHLGVDHHDGHGGAKDSMLPYESSIVLQLP